MKVLQTAISLVVIGGVTYFATDKYLPAWTAELRRFFYESNADWSEEAKRSDPVGYLEFSQGKLQEKQQYLETAMKDIRNTLQPLQDQIQQTRDEAAKTNALLNEGSTTYRQAMQVETSGEKAKDIKFAARTYPDINTFKTQLEVLFQEKVSKEALLKKSEATYKQLGERLAQMRLQLTQVEMAISQIPPQIALIKANVASEELNMIIKATEQVTSNALTALKGIDDSTDLIVTSKELLKGMEGGILSPPAGTNAEFEKFLQGQKTTGF